MAQSKEPKESRRYVKVGVPEKVASELYPKGFTIRFTVFEGEQSVFAQHRVNLVDLVEAQGSLYLRAIAPDGRDGYTRKDGTDAFGGLHEFVYPGFEIINSLPHARVKDLEAAVEKEALFDEQGRIFSGKKYDRIERKKTPLLEEVFIVEEGGKRGFILPDCSLFGKDMQEGEIDLKKFCSEVCLWVGKDRKEQYVSKDGKILYGGLASKLEEFAVGRQLIGLAKDEKGMLQLYSREGKKLYGDAHTALGKRKIDCGENGYILEVYDGEKLALLDENGSNHYGPYHRDPRMQGCTMVTIDNKILMQFLEEDRINGVVRYWNFDNTLAYGGPHEREILIGESNEPLMLAIEDELETIKKFSDKGKISYFSKDGDQMFGGSHNKEFHAFPWKQEMYVGFHDEDKGYCYFDIAGIAKFGGYHPKVRNVKMITFEKQGVKQHEAFLEVLEPVPVFSLRRLKNFLKFNFSLPITYYSLDGQKFDSLEEVQEKFQLSDISFEKLRRSDSVIMPAVNPSEAKKQLDELIRKAEKERENKN